MNDFCLILGSLSACAALGLICARSTEDWYFNRDRGRAIKARLGLALEDR
jgi:hypothetical protein